jgi:intracellular sulfur oxidation DsrE/DsrF family protein
MDTEDELRLHAYVDGELTPDQQAEVHEAIRRDRTLERRACELQNLKQQIRLAYAEPPPPRRAAQPARRAAGLRWVAGLALIALGALVGWQVQPPVATPGERLVLLDPAGRGQAPAAADSREIRIVFHLTAPEQTVAGELLDEVERMLASYDSAGRPLRIEVVSHGEGLALLRDRLSAHKDRVRSLARRYENLTFVACLNTMERLRTEQGIEVTLLPEAEVTRSGVSRVVKRQREGWAYIRV